ncbi:MAG TPA: Ppx/GppA phosphatase family protein [Acidimicrobiales bacterium]|nr:Ppx/GppA phosphatase family protein [Acidimicrobiales bacterium]
MGVLDLGSNSFHLLVVEVVDGSWETVAHQREHLPLADAVHATGRIGPALTERILGVVGGMVSQANEHGVARLTACATHAFRQAGDSDDVLALVNERCGVEVDVISGEREADLVFSAVAASVPLPSESLVADLGGGSLDLGVGDSGGSRWTVSLPLGAALLTARARRLEGHTGGSHPALVAEVLQGLRSCTDPAPMVEKVVGTGGTLAAVARSYFGRAGLAVPRQLNEVRLRRGDIEALAGEAAGMTASQRQRRYDISSRRAALLPAGAAVAAAVLEWTGVDELTLCDWGLREGLVMSALGLAPVVISPREESVRALRVRYPVDEIHAAHVAGVATELFDRTFLLHHLDRADRELLRYGALLTEIGRAVSAEAYEKHTASLIEGAPLRGFSPDDIAVLTCLGRYHRGGRPKDDFAPFATLTTERQQAATALVALLQVAVALDRSRRAPARRFEVHLKPGHAVLVVHDGASGVDADGVAQAARLFERTFGRRLELELPSSGRVEVPA